MAAVSNGQTIISPSGLATGSLGANNATYQYLPNVGFRVTLPARGSNFVILLPNGTSWNSRTHLDYTIRPTTAGLSDLTFAVSSGNGQGWFVSDAVLFGGTTYQLSVPLMTAQSWGLNCLPSIPGRLQTSSLGSFVPSSVGGIFLYNSGSSPTEVIIETLAVSQRPMQLTQFMDLFGQQPHIAFDGKVQQSNELLTEVEGFGVPQGYPYNSDSFGAVTGGPNHGAAPRFRTLKSGNRWHLVAPSGNRFFSFGVNEVGAVAWTQVQGREQLFVDLPHLQSNFGGHFSTRSGNVGFIPYGINLERKYGPNWRSMMDSEFIARMKRWGFNTFGANSWDSLMGQQQVPSTMIATIHGSHRKLTTYDGRTIHDVFDPAFETNAKEMIQGRVMFAHHPHNIGFFVDNEMPWGQGKSSNPNYRYALGMAALKAPAHTPSRSAFVRRLQSKYGTIRRLNRAWGTQYSSWTQMQRGTFSVPNQPNANMQTDLRNFASLFAGKYFETVKKAFIDLNYQGLYLGCRFTFSDYTPEVVAVARHYVDVLSFNVYRSTLDIDNSDLRQIDHPILISEVSFGASDMGRVGMPLYATLTEEDRVRAFRRYMNNIKTWPNVVGVHWYRWEDFPVTGKVDGDNMSLGLLSITDRPYTQLTAETRTISAEIMHMIKN
jgi:hypothetical protein